MHENQVRKQIEQRRKEGQKRKSRLIAKLQEKAEAGQQLKVEKELMTESLMEGANQAPKMFAIYFKPLRV